jgi:hypothetical protein
VKEMKGEEGVMKDVRLIGIEDLGD